MPEAAAIARNLNAIRERMAAAAFRSGRDPKDVTLVAVTKSVGLDAIRTLRELGVVHFGENRVESARAKIEAMAGEGVVWHMIGNVQRRKTRDVVQLFDRIDAVDRLALAESIQARCVERDVHASVLIEVNIFGEAQKHGFAPGELDGALAAAAAMDRITVRGLMAMAPYVADESRLRTGFGTLAALASAHGLPVASMGMSHDFEVAIECGATEVRVGSALFE